MADCGRADPAPYRIVQSISSRQDEPLLQMQAQPSPRFLLKCVKVTIDLKFYPVVNMNMAEVLIGNAPDWIAPRQRIDFSFALDLHGKERRLPTYGVVLTNDANGLDIRYRPPTSQWRDILVKLLSDEAA
jgi:hypothetical protein